MFKSLKEMKKLKVQNPFPPFLGNVTPPNLIDEGPLI
jgi:hypothetical protein